MEFKTGRFYTHPKFKDVCFELTGCTLTDGGYVIVVDWWNINGIKLGHIQTFTVSKKTIEDFTVTTIPTRPGVNS